MSQENVRLVKSLQPRSDADLVALLRDDEAAAAVFAALAPFFHEAVEVVAPELVVGASKRYVGLEGLRAAWLDWLEPWESYRVEVEDILDAGDGAVVLVRDFGRRAGMSVEASVIGAAVWTVRDGRVARVAFYVDRHDGLRAAGLEA
jgi:ketosteroid isomerase-like protein